MSTHGELGGSDGGGALGEQSPHTCPCGRQSFSHSKKSLKLMPPGSVKNSFVSLWAQPPEGCRLRYESSMSSSDCVLMVPESSASAIWKSVYTHFLNSSDQTSPSNEVHGGDGLGGGGDGEGGGGEGEVEGGGGEGEGGGRGGADGGSELHKPQVFLHFCSVAAS